MAKFKIANIMTSDDPLNDSMSVEVVFNIAGKEIRKNYKVESGEDANTFLERINAEAFRLGSEREKVLNKKVEFEEIKDEEMEAVDPSALSAKTEVPEVEEKTLRFEIIAATMKQGFVIKASNADVDLKGMAARTIINGDISGYVNVKSIKAGDSAGEYKIKLSGIQATKDAVGGFIEFADTKNGKLSNGFLMHGTLLAVPFKKHQAFSGGDKENYIEKIFNVKQGAKYKVVINLAEIGKDKLAKLFEKYNVSLPANPGQSIYVEFAGAHAKQFKTGNKHSAKIVREKFVAKSDKLKIRFYSDSDTGAVINRISLKRVFV